MRRFAWGIDRVLDERTVGRKLGSGRLTHAAPGAVLLSILLGAFPTQAAFDGKVDNLEKGYLMYQAVTACPLAPSGGAMDMLKAEIRRLEGGVNEGKRQQLWAEVSAAMPKVVALGLCEAFNAELQLFEMIHATENPPAAGPKPVF